MARMNVLCRRFLPAFAVALAALLVVAPVAARESRIISIQDIGGDPGFFDLTVRSVTYSAESGTVTVTGLVSCDTSEGNPAEFVIIGVTAEQTRGGETSVSQVDVAATCDVPFSVTTESVSGRPLAPGLATIEVSAVVGVFGGRGSEERLLRVALIP